jgi:hypothetical protein
MPSLFVFITLVVAALVFSGPKTAAKVLLTGCLSWLLMTIFAVLCAVGSVAGLIYLFTH